MRPNYALKGTLRTLREFPGYDVGAGPLNAALDPMKWTAVKLALSIAVIPASIVLLAFTGNGWFYLPIILSLPAIVLYWMDFGREVRSACNLGPYARAVGIAFGVPQALFGILAVVLGLGLVAWVLYNSFIERLPQYSGGFLTLGIGPLVVLFGVGCVVDAFRSGSPPP